MAEESNAFEEGKLAAESGQQVADNPYEAGSPEADQWEKGFQFVAEYSEDGEIPTDTP